MLFVYIHLASTGNAAPVNGKSRKTKGPTLQDTRFAGARLCRGGRRPLPRPPPEIRRGHANEARHASSKHLCRKTAWSSTAKMLFALWGRWMRSQKRFSRGGTVGRPAPGPHRRAGARLRGHRRAAERRRVAALSASAPASRGRRRQHHRASRHRARPASATAPRRDDERLGQCVPRARRPSPTTTRARASSSWNCRTAGSTGSAGPTRPRRSPFITNARSRVQTPHEP